MQPMDAQTRALLATEHVAQLARSRKGARAWSRQLRRRTARLARDRPRPEHDGRVPLNIRRHFGIQGFGVRANRSVGDGHVVGEHDELGLGASGQEELYLVLSGKATFNVDGEPIYATTSTMAFVGDPAAKRSAIAKEEGTTILAIGGTPGKA